MKKDNYKNELSDDTHLIVNDIKYPVIQTDGYCKEEWIAELK